jgi:hypothetical protein
MRMEEHFLDHVLRVRDVTQNPPRGAEHHRPVLAHDAIPVGYQLDLLIVR